MKTTNSTVNASTTAVKVNAVRSHQLRKSRDLLENAERNRRQIVMAVDAGLNAIACWVGAVADQLINAGHFAMQGDRSKFPERGHSR